VGLTFSEIQPGIWPYEYKGEWVSMKRKYTGIPIRMDAGQPGHANHAI
jgi:hypothetical protein